MLRALSRLREYVHKNRWLLIFGISAFFIARLLEGSVPLLLARAIDRLADGNPDVALLVLAIFAAVFLRFGVVSFARMTVRLVGLRVSFDLRERLYRSLQHQGVHFFNRHTIGDMMTRAVADIALIQRLFSMGTIPASDPCVRDPGGIRLHAVSVSHAHARRVATAALRGRACMVLLEAHGYRFSSCARAPLGFGRTRAGVALGHTHHPGHGAGRARTRPFPAHQPSLRRRLLRAGGRSIRTWFPGCPASQRFQL